MPISALIGAAGSLLGSIAGGLFGSKNQSNANDANMKLAEYKYDRDLDMWNRQNAYNTPEAQMRRYAQAGLNPNLIYGQGSSGNASGAPDFDAPTIGAYTNFGDFGASNAAGNYVAAFNADRQSDLAASQIEYQKAMMAQAYATTTGIELENLKKNVENARAYFDYGLQTKYGEEQIKASLANSWQNVKTSQASQQNLLSQVGVNNARENLLYKQAATEAERYNLTVAQTKQVNSAITEIRVRCRKLGLESALLDYELDTNVNPSTQKYFNEQSQRADLIVKQVIAQFEAEMGEQSRVVKVIRSIFGK